MGNLIRLTESDLHRIIKESVNRVLNEIHGVHGWYGDDPVSKVKAIRDFNKVADYRDERNKEMSRQGLEALNNGEMDDEMYSRYLRNKRKYADAADRDRNISNNMTKQININDYNRQKVENAIKSRLNILLSNSYGTRFGIRVKIVPYDSKNQLVIVLSPDIDMFKFDRDILSNIEKKIYPMVSKYGFERNPYGTNFSVFSNTDNACFIYNKQEKSSVGPISSINTQSKSVSADDGDNINLNDPNSGEAIRRNRAGSNEWSSSSAIENPFSSGSIYNLRRMYGGRRW